MIRPAAGLALLLLLVLAACGGGGSNAPAPVPFANPPQISSAGGVLDATLTVGPAELSVAGKPVRFEAVYNQLYMPPVLRVQPGDVIRLRLDNQAPESTNVHYHGLGVTPLGAGDNVFLDITPGTVFQYDFPIPVTHPQGLFWYHPHFHPMVNHQIAGGMSGGLIVGDILAPFPELAGIPERILLLKDLKTANGAPVADPDPTGPTTRTVNGLFKPRITMERDQLEFWRIGNIGANIYYKLRLPGVRFYVIAQDGNLQNAALESDTLLLPPGKRLEVLVYGPAGGGVRSLVAEAYDTGPAGDHYPAQTLATVVAAGPPVARQPLPTAFPVVPDLRDGPIDWQRTMTFADGDDNDFLINGRTYDHHCVDTVVTLGDTEEWTIENTSREAHVFHIHQVDFQVIEVNGVAQPFTGYQDTVNLPPASRSGPSVVKVIIPFTNPVIVGEFVYHCHIVQHADLGMMANIAVVDPANPAPVHRCAPR